MKTKIGLIALAFAVCMPKIATASDLETVKHLVMHYAEDYRVQRQIEPIMGVLECESGLKEDAYNGKDKHRGSVGSHGIAQFSHETFDEYSKKAGIENGDPYDLQNAIQTMVYMWSKNLQSRWKNCWEKVQGV